MNSRDRVITAIEHKEPDRVPLTVDMEKEVQEMLFNHLGISTREELWDALHIDTWLVGAHIEDPDPDAEIPEDEVKSAWGYRLRTVAYEKGTYNEQVYFPLAGDITKEDIDSYTIPDPQNVSFDPIRKAREDHPDRAIIAHITHGGYFNATFLRGLEQYLMDLFIDYDLAEHLVNKSNEFIIPAIEKLADEASDSFDIFYIADDYCDASRPLFPPEIFKKLVKPYLADIADIIHGAGKKFLLHVCGAMREILPDIIDAGVDLIEPVQTSAQGMEPEGLKRDFGDDLAFYGSIDLVNVLNKCTVEEIKEEVRKNIRALGQGGGLILGPGHTYIQIDAPAENIIAMYETAYEEGRY